MEGKALVHKLLEATGVNGESLEAEMKKVMDDSNVNEETLTLEQLREILANYLQDVLTEAKETYS